VDGGDQITETIGGLQVAARRLRGRTGSGLVGDFCDVVALAAGRIGLVVAVMPSPQAAGGMALARSVLRATANTESKPTQVLATLNRALLSWPPQEKPWLSGVYATVRPMRFGIRVRASVAGDQAALVRRSDGTVVSLGRPGSRLGLRADPNLADQRCMLRSGDSLVLVTESVRAALGGLALGGPALSGLAKGASGEE
jgi:serine phosphatase RsbU (regulator of sigma subunit)